MKSIEASEFNHFIHCVRNPLNTISLNAELGKMLIEDQGSTEQIKQAFSVILQQCKNCEQILTDMRQNNTDDTPR